MLENNIGISDDDEHNFDSSHYDRFFILFVQR